MESSPSNHDSQRASFVDFLTGSGDSGTPSHMLVGGSLGTVLLSVVVSIIAHEMLAAQMRIHWTLGMGPYYGPEFAPTRLILTLFPLLIATTAVLGYIIDSILRDIAEFAGIRPYYLVALLGTVGILLGSQILLIVANI